jgi:hypothetical protein
MDKLLYIVLTRNECGKIVYHGSSKKLYTNSILNSSLDFFRTLLSQNNI